MKLLCNCCNYVQWKPFEHVFLLVFCHLEVVLFWPFFTCCSCRLSSADLPCFLLLSGVCFDPWPFCMGGLPWCLLHPFSTARLANQTESGPCCPVWCIAIYPFSTYFSGNSKTPPTHTHTHQKREEKRFALFNVFSLKIQGLAAEVGRMPLCKQGKLTMTMRAPPLHCCDVLFGHRWHIIAMCVSFWVPGGQECL